MDPFFRKIKAKLEFNTDVFKKCNLIYKINFLKYYFLLAQELNFYLEKSYHKFTSLPLYLWIAAFILFNTSIIISYLIIFMLEYNNRSITKIMLNILLYIITFLLFYTGRIESLIINRKVIKFYSNYKN